MTASDYKPDYWHSESVGLLRVLPLLPKDPYRSLQCGSSAGLGAREFWIGHIFDIFNI